MPPWSAQQIFEPTRPPVLTDPDTREEVAPEDTPVRSRYRPEYDPRGMRAGAWMFNPALTGGTFYDSNVFSSNTNKQSDVAAVVGASLRAHSLWERHALDMQAATLSNFYRRNSGLDQTDATFKANGRYDIDHSTMVLGNFRAAYLHEGVGTLSSPTGAVEPTPYTYLTGDTTLRKEFGRVTTSVGGRIERYDFGSTRAQDGTIINQDARDGQIYSMHARFDYAFSEKAGFFTSVEGNERNLRGTPLQSLDSRGYRTLTGFDLELTPLIKAELAAGYMEQRFAADTIGLVAGPAYRVLLTWSPSRRLDIYFNTEQVVTQTSDTSATGVLARAFQAGFDYELRPNLIWSTAATYEKESFRGQDRSDDVFAADSRLKYVLGPVVSLSFWYRFTRRDSSLPEFSFDKHQVGINATARF